jgi:hypothetical protein
VYKLDLSSCIVICLFFNVDPLKHYESLMLKNNDEEYVASIPKDIVDKFCMELEISLKRR